MKYRMTAEAIQQYIEEVMELDVTSDDPAEDTIEKRIMAATAPNAGSVYRLNASVMGPDVLEDITKLAILNAIGSIKVNAAAGVVKDAAELIPEIAVKIEKTASLSYGNATLIPNGSNLDYLFASGTYYTDRTEGSSGGHLINRPTARTFILYVIRTHGGRCYQVAYTNFIDTPDVQNHKSGIYVRRKIDASLPVEGESDPDVVHALWTKWEMLATRDDIYSRVGNDMNDATEIVSGDDLDNYMTNGTYYCASRDIALGVGNTPVDWPFMLHVLRTTGQERFYQIAECHSTVDIDSGIYIRRRIKDGNVVRWTDWVHLATLSNALATRGLLQSADDLDTLSRNGVYHCFSASLPAHTPISTGGTIVVFDPAQENGYMKSQIYQSRDGVYTRYESTVVQDPDTGSHWTKWTAIGGGTGGQRVRVMQYNMGAFRRGYKSGREGYWTEALDIKSGSLPQALKNYKRFFAKYQPDILGVQEYSRYMGVDDKSLKENSTETCHAWNELFSELYQYVTSKHPESTDPEDAVGSRKLMTNAPIRDIPGLSNYLVSLFGTYRALAEGESPDDYEPLSQIPDYDPVTGEPNFGQVRGLLRNGTVVKGDVKNNAELGECYIGGKKIAIASLAGPNGTTNAALVETCLPGITVSDTAPENPTPSKMWYKTSAAQDEHDLPQGFFEWTSSGWQAFVPNNTPTVALTCKLGIFAQLADILAPYENAIIITDSNAPVSYNGIDYHTALVEMMAQRGYRAAVSIGGYWGAQTTYVVHGEEQVFRGHMDEYLNVQDLAARYDIGMYVDEHGETIHPMTETGNGKNNFRPIDNIFVKGNIKIRNVEVLADEWENLNSDHIPLIADLVIY